MSLQAGGTMKYNRQKELESYLREKQSLSNEELLKKFNISIQTLRRDLKKLEDQNLIRKVYGGVVYTGEPDSIREVDPLQDRNTSYNDEKEYIGKLAAAAVEDNDVIFIDSGTTAYRMLHYMKDLKNVTVISHCLDVMLLLKDMPNLTGICVGGTLMPSTGTFLADTHFYPYNYNKAFVSTVGISITRNLTNTNLQEGQMKAHVISHSRRVYVVADHSKFDVIAYNHFADIADADAFITDSRPSDKYVRLFGSNQTELIY